MLGSLLNSHPDLRCYDEIFMPSRLNKSFILRKKQFEKLTKNEGCIIMYTHYVRRMSQKQRDIMGKSKIIHLVRKDLDKHLYSMLANVKEVKDKNTHRNQLARRIHSLRRSVLSGKFGDVSNRFEITYEEICNNKNVTEYDNHDLCKFLGVKPCKLTTNLRKGDI